MTYMARIGAVASNRNEDSGGYEHPVETLLAAHMGGVKRLGTNSNMSLDIAGMSWPDDDVPAGFTGKSLNLTANMSDFNNTVGTGFLPSNETGLIIGTQEFTFETFIKIDTSKQAGGIFFAHYGDSTSYRRYWFGFNDSTWRIYFSFSQKSTNITFSVYYTVPVEDRATFWDRWHHIAAQKVGTEYSISVDGVKGEVVYNDTENLGINDENVFNAWILNGRVGFSFIQDMLTAKFAGIRLTKGSARYTSWPFSVPTTNHPIGVDDPQWANVFFYIQTDAPFNCLIDGTANIRKENIAYERGISNIGVFTPNGSRDRTGYRYSIPVNNRLDIVAGEDFTFELEYTRLGNSTNNLLNVLAGGTSPFRIINTTLFAQKMCIYSDVGDIVFEFEFNNTVNKKYHLCVTRINGHIFAYIDGQLRSRGYYNGALQNHSGNIVFNGDGGGSQVPLISGYRVSKGARYKRSTFVPLPQSIDWVANVF